MSFCVANGWCALPYKPKQVKHANTGQVVCGFKGENDIEQGCVKVSCIGAVTVYHGAIDEESFKAY